MDFFPSENQKHSPKHNKKRLTQDQVSLLETSFNSHKKLEPERKLQLARELGLPPRRIAVWYQNKRARWKAQSLELDYNRLQQRLDTTLAEKKRLEKDIERLREELKKAQEVVLALNNQTRPPQVSSCDEGGSSSLHHDVTCLENDKVWQLDELYAYYMGADGPNLY
ncbi:hypothetical protein L1049_000743 [Liquidambar formosana]|uniref:Homeobox-leucine zipper protein n=1 Tax=Liquidambar formosana TaxID=63359 RepID=A0AAP0NB03_LIQFO